MNLFKKLSIITLTLGVICVPTFAHQGRLDGKGGHNDNKNASGLGSYHYHCRKDLPAHLHENGICPYADLIANNLPYNENTTIIQATNITVNQAAATTTPTYIEKPINFVIDGQKSVINSINIDGTNLVELKSLCNQLGISVTYDASTKTVTGTKEGTTFKLVIGSKVFTLNGSESTLNVAPISYNGRTMIPARVIAEAIGKTVSFDGTTNTITIE